MTTKLLAVLALCVLIAACEPATDVTKPTASPAAQSTATPVPSPSPEATAPASAAAALKAGDKVKVTINGSAVEATIVAIDEKAAKATIKVPGETKERTVNLSDIVKQ
jgi:sRNA-binding protein